MAMVTSEPAHQLLGVHAASQTSPFAAPPFPDSRRAKDAVIDARCLGAPPRFNSLPKAKRTREDALARNTDDDGRRVAHKAACGEHSTAGYRAPPHRHVVWQDELAPRACS
mmetsp:Transcript_12409/g.31397  ORF Transcript_12409/g.31397 Transcript_12409/m.31397 type:complete len:111 (-) Transcript_12409:201-533(-)